MVGKSRKLPLISPVKNYSRNKIRSREGKREPREPGVEGGKFSGDSNPISALGFQRRFPPRLIPRADRLIRFLLRLRYRGIIALSAKLFRIRVYERESEEGSIDLFVRPVRDYVVFLRDREEAPSTLFLFPRSLLRDPMIVKERLRRFFNDARADSQRRRFDEN